MCDVERKSAGAQMRTGFWDAPRRDGQSAEDMYCSAFLLTNGNRNPVGLYPLNFRVAAARLKWDELQLRTVADRLQKQNEIQIEGNWVLIMNWWDHNNGRLSPSWDEPIRKSLEGVPTDLLNKWLKNCVDNGVEAERWLPGYTPPPPIPGDGVGSPPPHPVPQGVKQQQPNLTNIQKPTTTTEPVLELLPCAESYRHQVVQVAADFGLTAEQTQDLGWELSQRIQAQENGLGTQIRRVRKWLENLADQQKQGREILDAGAKLKSQKKSQLATQNKNTESFEKTKAASTAAKQNRTTAEKILIEADSKFIDDLKRITLSLPISQKHKSNAIEELSQRILPGAYIGTTLINHILGIASGQEQK